MVKNYINKTTNLRKKIFLNDLNMSSALEESLEILKARERNRIAAKRRRLKDKLVEFQKQNQYDTVRQENEVLKQKLEFLNHLKDLMNSTIQFYKTKNESNSQAKFDESSVAHFLNLESTQLYNLSLDIIDKIIPIENEDFGSEKDWSSLDDYSSHSS